MASLQAVERVAAVCEGNEGSSMTMPGCQGLGTSPVLRQLPEILPSALMSHPAFQQLQLQLLPFQVWLPRAS